MNLTLFDLALIALLAMLGAFFWSGLKAREVALAAIHRKCREMDLQFLDQGVALSRLRICQDRNRRWGLNRLYVFEFSSTGDERYRGYVEVQSMRVQDIHLAPHRLH